MSININSLPDELLIYLFSFLPPRDLALSRGSCSRWKLLGEDKSLWKVICRRNRIFLEGEAYTSFTQGMKRMKIFTSEEEVRPYKIKNRAPQRTINVKKPQIIGSFLVQFYLNPYTGMGGIKIRNLKEPKKAILSSAFECKTDEIKVEVLDQYHIALGGESVHIVHLPTGTILASKKLHEGPFAGKGDVIFIAWKRFGKLERWEWKKEVSRVFFDYGNYGAMTTMKVEENYLYAALESPFATDSKREEGTLLVWDLENEGNKIPEIHSNLKIQGLKLYAEGASYDLRYTQKGRKLVLMEDRYIAILEDGNITIKDIVDKKELGVLQFDIEIVGLKQLGCYLLAYDARGNIYLIDHKKLRFKLVLQENKKEKGRSHILFTETQLIRTTGNCIEIWDLNSLKSRRFKLLPILANFIPWRFVSKLS